MTAPDASEWYLFDTTAPSVSQQEAVLKFRTSHPAVTFARMTLIADTWLCIEGWLTTPDDQGPAPTNADIPIGFGRALSVLE